MAGNAIPKAVSVGFENIIPILRVRSIAASIDYYVQKLGFKIDWQVANLRVGVAWPAATFF